MLVRTAASCVFALAFGVGCQPTAPTVPDAGTARQRAPRPDAGTTIGAGSVDAGSQPALPFAHPPLPAPPTDDGSLKLEEFEAVMEKAEPRIQACAKHLEGDVAMVRMNWLIGLDGVPIGTRSMQTINEPLRKCLVSEIARLRFPKHTVHTLPVVREIKLIKKKS